jgi:hypothetical protein
MKKIIYYKIIFLIYSYYTLFFLSIINYKKNKEKIMI